MCKRINWTLGLEWHTQIQVHWDLCFLSLIKLIHFKKEAKNLYLNFIYIYIYYFFLIDLAYQHWKYIKNYVVKFKIGLHAAFMMKFSSSESYSVFSCCCCPEMAACGLQYTWGIKVSLTIIAWHLYCCVIHLVTLGKINTAQIIECKTEGKHGHAYNHYYSNGHFQGE